MKMSPCLSVALLAGSVLATDAFAQKSTAPAAPGKRVRQVQPCEPNPIQTQIATWQKVRRLADGRLIPTSPVMNYIPKDGATDFGEIRAFDRAQFAINAPFAPVGGTVCAGFGATTRYYNGTSYIMAQIHNDFTVAAGAVGDTDRLDVAFFWGAGAARVPSILVETYSDFANCVGTVPAATFVDGVIITLGAPLAGGGGYNTLTWNPAVNGALALGMPAGGSGSAHLALGAYDSVTAIFTLDVVPGTQPMLWGGQPLGSLAGTTNANEWDDDGGAAGPQTSDGDFADAECYDYTGAVACPAEPISATFAFWTTGVPPNGRCCLPNFTGCIDNSESQCATAVGVWTPLPVTCALNPCPAAPTNSACCTIAGCRFVSQALCTTYVGAVWQLPAGTLCPSVCAAAPAQLYDNGNIATGISAANGSFAPAGSQWSENQQDSVTLCTNGTNGIAMYASAAPPATFRMADDFAVPRQSWSVAAIRVPCYQTNTSHLNPSVFTGGNIQIWDRNPSDPLAVLEFGDNTTNRLGWSEYSGIIRTYWTGAPTNTAPTVARPLMYNWFIVPKNLLVGTHWLSVQVTTTPALGAAFIPGVIPALGVRGKPGGNAIQLTAMPNTWAAFTDAGISQAQCVTPAVVAQDIPFTVYGTAPAPCYVNMDQSTATPCLNVLDFQKFLNLFNAADPVTNCDNSTDVPILNVLDFQCFLNKFGAGCSNC